MKRAVVIGGGIAGLSAAYYLKKKAEEAGLELSLEVFESDHRWGGKISTVVKDGFVVEGGPDTFLAAKPWAVDLCRELGLEDRLQGTNPEYKSTYVLNHGRLRPLPEGLTMMIPTRFSPMIRTRLLSWPAKARMGLDFFLPAMPLDRDESLGAFVTRRLGRTAYESLIEPLMSGIYAGDGDKLSLQSTFPYLRELELKYGGLVKGALVTRKKLAKSGVKAPGTRSAFLTPRSGLQEIVHALVGWLESKGVELRLNTAVRSIKRAGAGYRVELDGYERVPADTVILAAPAFASADLLSDLDSELANDLRAIPYVSTATVSLAYRKSLLSHPLDGYGYVIPRRESRRALACTWTSTKFPHRAPEEHVLLRVFMGRAGEEANLPADEAGLRSLAEEELRETLGIQAEPLFAKVFYWERAMPQYNLGHPARLRRIETAIERLPGLALAGNGYRGIGIPDCIRSGELAAEKAVNQVVLLPVKE